MGPVPEPKDPQIDIMTNNVNFLSFELIKNISAVNGINDARIDELLIQIEHILEIRKDLFTFINSD